MALDLPTPQRQVIDNGITSRRRAHRPSDATSRLAIRTGLRFPGLAYARPRLHPTTAKPVFPTGGPTKSQNRAPFAGTNTNIRNHPHWRHQALPNGYHLWFSCSPSSPPADSHPDFRQVTRLVRVSRASLRFAFTYLDAPSRTDNSLPAGPGGDRT